MKKKHFFTLILIVAMNAKGCSKILQNYENNISFNALVITKNVSKRGLDGNDPSIFDGFNLT